MNRNSLFAIVTIISSFSLFLVGVFIANAQESPPKSGDSSRGAQTSDPVTPPVERGVVTPVPSRDGATQGPTGVHTDTRQRSQDQVRQTRPSGAQDTQPSSSAFKGSINNNNLQAAIKVQPQNQVSARNKTPCGSPECLGAALTTRKPLTSQSYGMVKGSGNVGGPNSMGTARLGRR
jgi:hypothetical protein